MNIEELKELLKKQTKLVKWCSEKRIQDPELEPNWEKMFDILKTNFNECIKFLEQCSQEELETISPIFEDLSIEFKSKEFVNSLNGLLKKFPKADIKDEIVYAEEAIK